MSDIRTSVTGLILAGGMGRRMNGADKGLVMLQQHQMVTWVVNVLQPNVHEIIINANRNISDYEKLQVKVVTDSIEGFQGPLAGFEAGLAAATTEWVFTCPCDSPMQSPELLPHMFNVATENNAEIAVAFDGERTHPVFSLVRTELLDSLRTYLNAGDRKIDRWFDQHKLHTVDCSKFSQSFVNINTEEELEQAQLAHAALDTSATKGKPS